MRRHPAARSVGIRAIESETGLSDLKGGTYEDVV